jgi:SH3-like domain-containing protein
MRVGFGIGLKLALIATALSPTLAFADKKPPYWASIAASEARMRTGPGRQFPASWTYHRANLPVHVIATYPNWRKVQDPDGTIGWMQASLLSASRTGLVVGDVRPLRDKPDSSGRVIFRAEPGVVGRLSECSKGWCKLDVTGRMGYIEAGHLFGVEAEEAKP